MKMIERMKPVTIAPMEMELLVVRQRNVKALSPSLTAAAGTKSAREKVRVSSEFNFTAETRRRRVLKIIYDTFDAMLSIAH